MSATPFANDVSGRERADRRAARQRRVRYVLLRLFRQPSFVIAALVLLFWICMALGWRFLVPHDPFALDATPLQGPSGSHWFGTDDLGRDVFSRVLAGAAPVLTIAPAAAALSICLGGAIGLASGYYRGFADEIIMRAVDALQAFPAIIIAVIVIALLGTSTRTLILVIAVLYAPWVSRTVRSAMLAERERAYVEAARLRGEHAPRIIFLEILPNITGPIIVEATVRLGYAVFTAATLAFLGLGVQTPSPDWGLTIAQERIFVQTAWWTTIFPAVALASLVVSVNLIVDNLRRAVVS